MRCAEANIDEKKKCPVGIPASSDSRLGYIHRNNGGRAEIAIPDHDFPITPRMLMQLSGVSICTAPPSIPKGSPLSPTFRPSEVHGFVRSLRYNPGNAATNAQDLFNAVHSSDACKDLEIFLIVSDNGGDYSMDQFLLMMLYGRLWRKMDLAMMLVLAYAAGDSSYNWKVSSKSPK